MTKAAVGKVVLEVVLIQNLSFDRHSVEPNSQEEDYVSFC